MNDNNVALPRAPSGNCVRPRVPPPISALPCGAGPVPVSSGSNRPAPISLITVLGLLSLFSSITNYVPLAASLSVLSLFVLPLAFGLALTSDWRIFTIIALIAYNFCSAVIYDPFAFVDPSFYRRDGNFFVSVPPLLVLLVLAGRGAAERWVFRFLIFSLSVYLAFFVLWLGTGLTLRPGFVLAPYAEFNPLFESNNAAGGFLSILASFALGFAYTKRSTTSWLAATMLSAFVVSTYSRGSMLGLAVTSICALMSTMWRFRIAPPIIFGAVALVSLLIAAVPYTQNAWLVFDSEDAFRYAFLLDEAKMNAKEANVLLRTEFLFPLALALGAESPIFGIGFGAFDDRPYQLATILPHILSWNRPDVFLHTDSHAHNTYLHVFAEQGLVGVVLLVAYLSAIHSLTDAVASPALRRGLKMAFWTLIFASVTEHRLFTPSNALPFNLVLGLALAGRFAWPRTASATRVEACAHRKLAPA